MIHVKQWPFEPLKPFSYDLVMCDPPWPWKAYSAAGLGKSPEAQYQTMSLRDIENLPVGDLLAPGGVLFLWATWPLVVQDVPTRMMRMWGVPAKTGGVWAKRTPSGKSRWGTGYILRSLCEPFLVGSLGSASTSGGKSCPNMIETVDWSVIDGVAREHSRKPEEAYELLEKLSPGARRADIFSRQSRPGWDGWGLEATKFDGAAE